VFGLEAVLELVREEPDLIEINSNLNEVYWQRTRDKLKLEYVDNGGVLSFISV
jgi:hypothetical protein